jgi:hypothetical protein
MGGSRAGRVPALIDESAQPLSRLTRSRSHPRSCAVPHKPTRPVFRLLEHTSKMSNPRVIDMCVSDPLYDAYFSWALTDYMSSSRCVELKHHAIAGRRRQAPSNP